MNPLWLATQFISHCWWKFYMIFKCFKTVSDYPENQRKFSYVVVKKTIRRSNQKSL